MKTFALHLKPDSNYCASIAAMLKSFESGEVGGNLPDPTNKRKSLGTWVGNPTSEQSVNASMLITVMTRKRNAANDILKRIAGCDYIAGSLGLWATPDGKPEFKIEAPWMGMMVPTNRKRKAALTG